MNSINKLSDIVDNGLCIGCGLCQSIAGKDKIEISMSSKGRLEPKEVKKIAHETFDKISDARSFMFRRYRVIFQGNRCMLFYLASGFLFLTATKFPKNIFQTWNPNTI